MEFGFSATQGRKVLYIKDQQAELHSRIVIFGRLSVGFWLLPVSPLTYPEERAARSQRETMLVDSRYRIRNGTALQWQPAAGACTVLSEFTASNFTVHRLLESSEKAFPPWLGSSLPPPPPSSLFSFPLYSFHPLHSSAVFPLPEGRVSRGDSLRVQDRTTPLYISIPQLRRRFSPRLDKKKGTLVRDDQPRETVARKGWVVDNVGNRPRRWRESHPLSEGSRGISQLSRKYSRVPIHLSFGFSFFSLSLFYSEIFLEDLHAL